MAMNVSQDAGHREIADVNVRQTLATNWLRVLMTLKLMSQLMMIMMRNTHQTRFRSMDIVCSKAIIGVPTGRMGVI